MDLLEKYKVKLSKPVCESIGQEPVCNDGTHPGSIIAWGKNISFYSIYRKEKDETRSSSDTALKNDSGEI